jgi:hypothetical protein
MAHSDYDRTPLLATVMVSMIAYDVYEVVLGSRIAPHIVSLSGDEADGACYQ